MSGLLLTEERESKEKWRAGHSQKATILKHRRRGQEGVRTGWRPSVLLVAGGWNEMPTTPKGPNDNWLVRCTLWHKIITYEKLFWNNYFEKLRIPRVISGKSLSFLEILRVQIPSKITKNNSQGIIFVIISCQRVLFVLPPLFSMPWPLLEEKNASQIQESGGRARGCCYSTSWKTNLVWNFNLAWSVHSRLKTQSGGRSWILIFPDDPYPLNQGGGGSLP